MPNRFQPGFFDIHERTAKLTEMGDPLVGLNEQIDWEVFRPSLNGKRSPGGVQPLEITTGKSGKCFLAPYHSEWLQLSR